MKHLQIIILHFVEKYNKSKQANFPAICTKSTGRSQKVSSEEKLFEIKLCSYNNIIWGGKQETYVLTRVGGRRYVIGINPIDVAICTVVDKIT